MRVDWGPSSVIFDDLLGLYYRTNRGIFGMAPKEQDREWCLAGKWSPESNDHRVYPSTISSWAMYSAGLGSYCHFTLQMTVANDWRRRTRKFRSVVINWGVLLECVKCGKLFGRLMLLYVQAVDTRCRLVVGAAKVRLSESIQVKWCFPALFGCRIEGILDRQRTNAMKIRVEMTSPLLPMTLLLMKSFEQTCNEGKMQIRGERRQIRHHHLLHTSFSQEAAILVIPHDVALA